MRYLGRCAIQRTSCSHLHCWLLLPTDLGPEQVSRTSRKSLTQEVSIRFADPFPMDLVNVASPFSVASEHRIGDRAMFVCRHLCALRDDVQREEAQATDDSVDTLQHLSLIHISEPTRLGMISY